MINRLKRLHAAMFDRGTIHGNLFMIVVSVVVCLYIGYGESFHIWMHNSVFGVEYPYQLPNLGQLRTRRFWAGVLFTISFLVHVIALLIVVHEKLHRRRAKKSAQGQWYDTDNLSKEDLYADKGIDDEPK